MIRPESCKCPTHLLLSQTSPWFLELDSDLTSFRPRDQAMFHLPCPWAQASLCRMLMSLILSPSQFFSNPTILHFNCTSATACQTLVFEMTFLNDPEKAHFSTKLFSMTWFYIWLLFAVKTESFDQSCFLSDSPLPAVLSLLPCSSAHLPTPSPVGRANSAAGGISGRRPNLASDHFSSTHTGLWKPDSVCHLVCSPSFVSFRW